MKMIIQIPCYNEELSLPFTLAELPRTVVGFDSVEWLVIDDGSNDRTAAVALELGVDHLVRFNENRGLSAAFMAGISACLQNGADVVVNTDADNQYCAADIIKLLEPVLSGRSGFVVGLRPVYQADWVPFILKALHWIGSKVVMYASKTTVSDPPSGFRAFSRDVAEKLVVFNDYTYTLETIIQAGNSDIDVATVPIRINPGRLRPSRLMTSPYSYVVKSAGIILHSLFRYNKARFFLLLASPLAAAFILLYHVFKR